MTASAKESICRFKTQGSDRIIIGEGTKGTVNADQVIHIPEGLAEQSDVCSTLSHMALLEHEGSDSSITISPEPETLSEAAHTNEDITRKKTDEERDDATLAIQQALGVAGVAGSLAIAIPVTVNLLGTKTTEIPHPEAFKVMGVLSGAALISSVVACIFRIVRGMNRDLRHLDFFTWVFLGNTLFLVLSAIFYGIGSFLK